MHRTSSQTRALQLSSLARSVVSNPETQFQMSSDSKAIAAGSDDERHDFPARLVADGLYLGRFEARLIAAARGRLAPEAARCCG
jgi:hypothetical protein